MRNRNRRAHDSLRLGLVTRDGGDDGEFSIIRLPDFGGFAVLRGYRVLDQSGDDSGNETVHFVLLSSRGVYIHGGIYPAVYAGCWVDFKRI